MTLFEWEARLWKPATVSGVMISARPPLSGNWIDLSGYAVRCIVAMDNDQVQVWCVDKDTWPNGVVNIVLMPHATLADAEVLGHMGIDYAIYDTDEVRINGESHNLPSSIWVSKLTIGGPGAYGPPAHIVWTGEYREGKTRRTVQFLKSEVRAIRRLEP